MLWLIFLFSVLPSSTVKCQLHDSTLAVQVETHHLKNLSSSVLMAESWLRTYILPFYPSTNITAIIVGHSLLCRQDQRHNFGFILPSVKNIHYSLTRWGLQNDIKVCASFSPDCLDSMSETYLKPLLTFLQQIDSTYVVNPLSDKTASIENLGFSHNLKPLKRKLLFIDISNSVLPFPPRPTPVIAPSHSPSRPSNPAYAVGSPLPPLVGTVTPPPQTLPVAPSLPPSAATNPITPPFLPPMANPATPPYGPHLPPCEPSHGGAPGARGHHGLWCVAKPSVPAETLQEALDYACGEGNADCEAIQSDGSCYYPDNLVAHASYAFNSYWQKTKKNGGTCGFGGTAMLVNSDPSYAHCRYNLA